MQNCLTFDEFKKKLLNVKSNENYDQLTEISIKDEAIRLVSIFPDLFGDDLDRLTLWDRISSALETSIIKANGDIEVFVNFCLDHIKSKASKVAVNEGLKNWLETNQIRSIEWKVSFFSYLNTRSFIIIARAKEKWEQIKKERKIEKEANNVRN